MTTFILAGGCDRQYSEYRQQVFEVIRKEVSNPTILSCMFASPEETRPERHEAFAQWFREELGEDTKVLYAQSAQFYEQIEKADVIYLHGGRTQLLLDAIKDVTLFREAVEGKIVVGSSAGANFIVRSGYSPSSQMVMRGAGLLGVGVVVHYGIERFEELSCTIDFWRDAAQKVRSELGDEIPLVLLPEGQFSVFRA